MRLAERLGKTERQLLREIGSEELSRWMAKDRIDPPINHWETAGMLAAVIANVMGGGKKKFTPADFMPAPRISAPKRKQTVQEMRAIFGGFAQRHANQ